MEIEHIVPLAKGGLDDEQNLWLACRTCNNFKSDQTEGRDALTSLTEALFNPREQKWLEHFRWSEDGIRVIGITAIGRATIDALQLNNDLMLAVRRLWVQVSWHPQLIK